MKEQEPKNRIIAEPTLSLHLSCGSRAKYFDSDNFEKELLKYKFFHLRDGIYFVRDIHLPKTVTVLKTHRQQETTEGNGGIIEVFIDSHYTISIDDLASILFCLCPGADYQDFKNILDGKISRVSSEPPKPDLKEIRTKAMQKFPNYEELRNCWELACKWALSFSRSGTVKTSDSISVTNFEKVSGEAKPPDSDDWLWYKGFIKGYRTRMGEELSGGSVPTPSDEEIEAEIQKLPYTKHLDDGQFNDGVIHGFEMGAKWLRDRLSPEQENSQG